MDEDHSRDRQTERLREAVDRKAEAARVASHEETIDAHSGSQDVLDPRAKNSGHKKKTADKWNQ